MPSACSDHARDGPGGPATIAARLTGGTPARHAVALERALDGPFTGPSPSSVRPQPLLIAVFFQVRPSCLSRLIS